MEKRGERRKRKGKEEEEEELRKREGYIYSRQGEVRGDEGRKREWKGER